MKSAMADPVATWWRSTAAGMGATDDWRCAVPSRHLPGAGPLNLQEHSFPDDQQGETAIFMLPGEDFAVRAIHEGKRQGLRVLVDLDDAAITPNFPLTFWAGSALGEVLLGPTGSREPAAISAWRTMHRNAVTAADGLITNSSELARIYSRYNANVYVCPSCVDVDDWPAPAKPGDGIFRVGFAGGTTGRVEDLELVRPAFEWASAQDSVEVVLVGTSPASQMTVDEQSACDDLLRNPPARYEAAQKAWDERGQRWKTAKDARQAAWRRFPYRQIPFIRDRADYRRTLGILDVGLCPLIPNAWNVAGSGVRVPELVMAGVLPICSDVEPFAPWRDGPIPFARDADDFLRLVKWAIANRDRVRELADEARRHVLAERTIEQNIWRWREACGGS